MNYTDSLLDELRTVGDPELDSIVADLVQDGQLKSVSQILQHLIHNRQAIPTELPDNIEAWLRTHQSLPGWVDLERLNRASRFYTDHGIPITLLLATSGLVSCYAAKKGAKVLTFTYRLEQTPYHRIAETGQYILLALAPDGLSPRGRGLMATLKIRLIHAAVRRLIQQSGKWDEAEMGVPINQEDLLGTLIVFSYGTLWGLEQLGVSMSDEEKEDYLYAWQIIGELMGIDPKAIPTSIAEAKECGETIARRQHGASPEGVQLTKALLEMHSDLVPGELLDGVIPALIRRTVGDEMADYLEIPKSVWEIAVEHVPVGGKLLDRMDDAGGFISQVVDEIGLALLQREGVRVLGYANGPYEMPDTLPGAWRVAPTERRL
jgi:hypothetical protein